MGRCGSSMKLNILSNFCSSPSFTSSDGFSGDYYNRNLKLVCDSLGEATGTSYWPSYYANTHIKLQERCETRRGIANS